MKYYLKIQNMQQDCLLKPHSSKSSQISLMDIQAKQEEALAFYQRVNKEAKTESGQQPSLMELLNKFDLLVAQDNKKRRENNEASSANGNEVHNEVYRMILQSARDKASNQINDTTEEIKSMQANTSDKNEKITRNRDIEQQQQFEFQGSFGGDQLASRFQAEGIRAAILQSPNQSQKKKHLPKISLESVIDIQKNEGKRSQKLSEIEKKKSHVRQASQPGVQQHQRHVSGSASQSRMIQGVTGLTSPSKRSQMNKDIHSLMSPTSRRSSKSPTGSTHRSAKRSAKKVSAEPDRPRLPKLNLSDLVDEMGSTLVKQNYKKKQERAIDSNRAIAFAYYTRRLMLVAFRSFFNYRLEQTNKRFFLRICIQKRNKALKKRVFKGFFQHIKLHPGHNLDNRRALLSCHQKLSVKYFALWIQAFKEHSQERSQVSIVRSILDKFKKHQVTKAWRNATLRMQLKHIQNKTALHIYRQRYLKLGLLGLKVVSDFRNNTRRLQSLSEMHNNERLMRKTITAMQMSKYIHIKQQEMVRIADKVFEFNLMRNGLKQLQRASACQGKYRKLKQCAENYHNLSVTRVAFEILKLNKLSSLQQKSQNSQIRDHYSRKIMMKFFRFIRLSNKEFRRREQLVINHMIDRGMRMIMTAWKLLSQKRRVKDMGASNQPYVYYTIYNLWFKNSNSYSFTQQSPSLPLINSAHYKYLQSQATKRLHQYIFIQVFNSWKQHYLSVKSFKLKLHQNLLSKIVSFLTQRSRLNGRYRYILNKYLSQKRARQVQSSFDAIRLNRATQVYQRMIINKFGEMRAQQTMRQFMIKWQLQYKKKEIRNNQKSVAIEISEKRCMESTFHKWRANFSKFHKKRLLKETSQNFLRQKYLSKHFTQMLSAFYQLQGLELILKRHKLKLRQRSLKKSLCGFLQNVLLQNRKNYLLSQAVAFRDNIILKKSVYSWKLRMPELRQKNTLLRVIRSELLLKYKLRVLQGWKMYLKYRHQKVQTDHFMSLAVQQVSSKRFFNQWRNHLKRRTGLKMLEHTWSKYRQRELYSRIVRKEEFEENVNRHMVIFNAFKLLEFTFQRGLKRNVELKYLYAENTARQYHISNQLSKKMHLRVWRELYCKSERDLKMAQFCLIQIKNQILKKYLQPIKQLYMWRLKKRQTIQDYQRKVKVGYFSQMKQITKKSSKLKTAFNQKFKERRTETLITYMQHWINELYEVNHIKPVISSNQRRLLIIAMNSWKLYRQNQLTDDSKMQRIRDLANVNLKKHALTSFKFYTQSCLRAKLITSQITQLTTQSTLKLYLSSLYTYYKSNLPQIRSRILIKNKLQTKSLTSLFNHWLEKSQPRLIKVRVARCLCDLSRKSAQRAAYKKWIRYAIRGQQIDNMAMSKHEQKLKGQKIMAVRKLRTTAMVRRVQREREGSVREYWRRKVQMRVMEMLRQSTGLVRRRRQHEGKAMRYRRWRLMKKCLQRLIDRTRMSKTLKHLTNTLRHTLLLTHAPKFLASLNLNHLNSKSQCIKNQFASEFSQGRTYLKAYKALVWHTQNKRQQKAKVQAARGYFKEKIIREVFAGWQWYSENQLIMKSKRQTLSMSIHNVDHQNLLYTAFHSLALNRVEQQQKLGYLQLQLLLNSMQRVFDSIRFYAYFRRSLKDRQRLLQEHLQERRMRGVLGTWTRQLTIEVKTRMLERCRERGLKEIALAAIQRHRSFKQIVRLSLQRRVVEYLQTSFSALQSNMIRNKKLRVIQQQLIYKELVTTVEKAFMALRYHSILAKNQRLVQERTKQSLTLRSFSGWKYHLALDKTLHYYTQLRQQRDQSFFFTHWLSRAFLNTRQKQLLTALNGKKDRLEKTVVFVEWKKQVYREVYLEKLKKIMLRPREREVQERCLRVWRKYSRYSANKDLFHQQLSTITASYTARKFLRLWVESATQNDGGAKLKMRMMTKKLESTLDKLLLKKSIDLMKVYGIRQEYIAQNVQLLIENRTQSNRFDYFAQWRKRYQTRQISKMAKQQTDNKLVSQCFTAMVAHTRYSQIKKDIVEKTAHSLMQVTSMDTRLAIVQSFLQRGSTLNSKSLQAYYFYLFLQSIKYQKRLKYQFTQAVQFRKYQLYLKCFYTMHNYTLNKRDSSVIKQRSKGYLREQRQIKVLKGLVYNTLKQRKYKNARAFYNSKICSKAIQAWQGYHDDQYNKALMKSRMMHLLKKKCFKLFKGAFVTWRVKFQDRLYREQAIVQYHQFREMKLKRDTFGYLAAVCDKQRQIRDMTRKARNCFFQKRQFKIMHKVYQVLKHYTKRRKHLRDNVVDRELQALRFYAFYLQQRHFKAWRKEVLQNQKRHMRSKLYAIFSAWKFYIKERSLLKRYLRECNGLYGDPSLMSTSELKENYARMSHPKSLFGESLSSGQGTPYHAKNFAGFGSSESQALRAIDVNLMPSPHFNRALEPKGRYGNQENEFQATGHFSTTQGHGSHAGQQLSLQKNTGEYHSQPQYQQSTKQQHHQQMNYRYSR